jgi:hypothetical protein
MKTRRAVAWTCIAVFLVAALMPAVVGSSPAAHAVVRSAAPADNTPQTPSHTPDFDLEIVLPLDVLLGAVLSVPLDQPDDVDLAAPPFLSVRVSRGPPTA